MNHFKSEKRFSISSSNLCKQLLPSWMYKAITICKHIKNQGRTRVPQEQRQMQGVVVMP